MPAWGNVVAVLLGLEAWRVRLHRLLRVLPVPLAHVVLWWVVVIPVRVLLVHYAFTLRAPRLSVVESFLTPATLIDDVMHDKLPG